MKYVFGIALVLLLLTMLSLKARMRYVTNFPEDLAIS